MRFGGTGMCCFFYPCLKMVVGTVPPEPFLETTVINIVVEDNIPFGLGFQISYLNWCRPRRMFFTKPSTFGDFLL